MKTGCCNSHQYYKMEDISFCLNSKCNNYLGTTSLVKPAKKKLWINLFTFYLMVFLLLVSLDDYSQGNDNVNPKLYKQLVTAEEMKPLSLDNLREEIYRQQIICPEHVFAQVKIESAYLNSFLTKRTNNMFGMRYPFKRQTAAIGLFLPESNSVVLGTQKELAKYRGQNTYAVYEKWQDAITDYKLWQDQNFKLDERYLAFLDGLYAEDPDYIQKIRSIAMKQ
jgi:hypothetical protein